MQIVASKCPLIETRRFPEIVSTPHSGPRNLLLEHTANHGTSSRGCELPCRWSSYGLKEEMLPLCQLAKSQSSGLPLVVTAGYLAT